MRAERDAEKKDKLEMRLRLIKKAAMLKAQFRISLKMEMIMNIESNISNMNGLDTVRWLYMKVQSFD